MTEPSKGVYLTKFDAWEDFAAPLINEWIKKAINAAKVVIKKNSGDVYTSTTDTRGLFDVAEDERFINLIIDDYGLIFALDKDHDIEVRLSLPAKPKYSWQTIGKSNIVVDRINPADVTDQRLATSFMRLLTYELLKLTYETYEEYEVAQKFKNTSSTVGLKSLYSYLSKNNAVFNVKKDVENNAI